jgi:hypothetical protein
MIEEEYALSTRYMVQDQFLDFWIVSRFYLVFGGKVLAVTGDIGSSGETVGVQFKIGFLTADIGDLNGRGVFGVISLGQAWWWLFNVVPGCRVICWWGVEDQGRGYGSSGYFDILVFGSGIGECCRCCCGCCGRHIDASICVIQICDG